MTYVSLATALPAILISLTAGVLADRYNRKMLIVLSAAVVTLLTLLVASIFAFYDARSLAAARDCCDS